MKNKTKLILFIAAFIFFIPFNVHAIGICPARSISKYRSSAQKITFKYELYKVEEGEGIFKVTALNVNPDVVIEYEGIEYKAANKSNTIQFEETFLQNREYSFSIRTNDELDECPRAYLTTKSIKTPKYNFYSENDACIEYEEFPLCNKYYEGEIKDYNEFEEKLHEFIESTKTHSEEYKDDRSLIQKIIDFYLDNIEICLSITILIALVIVIHIGRKIYRKAKRIKIDL